MVKLITHLCGVGTITDFLFREGNCTFDLSSNYRMDLEHARTSLIKTMDKVKELVMTLNKSKLKPKWMTGLSVRLAWSTTKATPETNEKMRHSTKVVKRKGN